MMTEVQKQYIAEHYPNEYAKDIAQALGVSVRAVEGFVWRNGIKKTDEFWLRFGKKCQFKTGETRAQRYGAEREKLCIDKIGKTIRAIIRRDKMRIEAGLKPASKRIYSPYSKKRQLLANEARRRLVVLNGYIVERGGNVFFYDDNTRRSALMEKRGADKYGFKFVRVGCDVEKIDVKAEWKHNGQDDFNRIFNFS